MLFHRVHPADLDSGYVGASRVPRSKITAMLRAWTAFSDSCRLVSAPFPTLRRICAMYACWYNTKTHAVGVRTKDLHTAGFVMMLMDVAIRFSKAGTVTYRDADGSAKVRTLLAVSLCSLIAALARLKNCLDTHLINKGRCCRHFGTSSCPQFTRRPDLST